MFDNKNIKFKKNFFKNADFLKMIGEPNRLKIIYLLRQGEQCVCGIWKSLDMSQNLASHHLKILKEFNLIESRQEGRKVIYFLNKKCMKKNVLSLNNFLI
ncbi:MAG: winged helix-turn-helix transcriptional regulator [Candidatus Moranbacteria bacterium]|nr:winged helix-turn-helix transcriptional regulator [Candidatus Moranbacteria bacterium]